MFFWNHNKIKTEACPSQQNKNRGLSLTQFACRRTYFFVIVSFVSDYVWKPMHVKSFTSLNSSCCMKSYVKKYKKKYLSRKFRGLSKIPDIRRSSTDKLNLSKNSHSYSSLKWDHTTQQHGSHQWSKEVCYNEHWCLHNERWHNERRCRYNERRRNEHRHPNNKCGRN